MYFFTNFPTRLLSWQGLVAVFVLIRLALGASFYGDGYMELKTVETWSRSSLYVRFRTSRPSGMLFLAAGHTDYCLVELHSTRLQVKLDLGSGERILRSEKGTPLNDLAWHTAELQHENNSVTLTVDKHFQTSVKMPGQLLDLSIQEGLYVGGTGGLDKPYLVTEPSGFRGCIDELLFNQHNLLSSLRSYYGFKHVYEVSLGCSPQFFASEDDPVSFFSSKAYISFPLWNVREGGVFECVVHTSAEQGLLLYNSARQGDFVAMEIREGLIIAVVGKGGSKNELSSLSQVNDRKWHYVKLQFTSRNLQLTVDEETVKTSLSSHSKGLSLMGPLFIGGIDDSTLAEVRNRGLVSVSGKRARGGSFKGCLKDIKANSEKMGLKNAVVTKDISVGCEPEKEPDPTVQATPTTVPLPQVPYTSAAIPTSAKPQDKKHGSFLALNNLVVPEGGRASLGSKHIKVSLEFKKLGIRQSQIIFKIQEQPVHGQLRLDIDQDQEENTFSMLDLWHGRVMYIHGGSEDPLDFFMFSVIVSSKKEVPPYLKGNKQYRFNISITPTNDAPELTLLEGNLFVLLENSKKPLTADVLKATDIDSNSTELVFSVLGNLNADAGYLENTKNPGKAVNTFSHPDLEEGRIQYVHSGVRNSRIVLRVSDGDKVSNTVVLRIMAIPLDYNIANNTGVEVTQGEVALISTNHLAVQTNAVKQELDIRYDIIEPPKYGEVQRWHSSGEWKPTNTFSQRTLERERVRYVSTYQELQSSNAADNFKCKVSIGSLASEELVFPVTVKWVQYKLLKNNALEIDKVKRVALNSEHLHAVVKGVTVAENNLYYRLLTLPKKGKLLLNHKVLKKNSTFSQRNVTEQKVEYELVERPREDSQDMFTFQVISKHAHSGVYDFKLAIKADVNSIILTNTGLSLTEGESKLITKEELFSETLITKEMFYKITSSPKYGKLKRINLSDSASSNDNMTAFTNADILGERILYVHDDSETIHDEFTFIASLDKSGAEAAAVESSFNISIELKNDEKPVRVVDKIFHVARNGQKLLTVEDLCYHDGDSDFDDGQLLYTRRGIPNGDLVLVNDTSHKLYQFHQEDLELRRVLFLHRGTDYGRFVLFVTDGKHYTSSLLEVSAHEPYIQIANSTGLLVQKGHAVSFSAANFSVATNMDVRDDKEVTYKLFLLPKHGGLYINDLLVDSFTQRDLRRGQLVYQHDNSNNLVDRFNFTVKVKNVRLDAGVFVRVYLESHQRPPKVVRNSTLLVEEGKPVKISKRKLEVVHEDSLPVEIVYTVKIAPAYGYIRSFAEGEEQYLGSEQAPIQSFTQQDINDGNIQYVQVTADQHKDSMELQVSNGVTEVGGIQVCIDVIPRLIPLTVSSITLKEGSAKALTEDIIQVTNQHFAGLDFEYSLWKHPQHGQIEHSRTPGVKLLVFTRKQVQQEFIYYVHDDSETTSDNFTIIANDTELQKQSQPCTVYVNITPVNDEAPVITANTILKVWVSSVTEITQADLNSEDKDSPPEELNYVITPPSNGHLALKSSANKSILNFTQAHVNNGEVVFVHSGAMSGGFSFQVSDGLNFAPRQIFSVTARALLLRLDTNQHLQVFPGSLTPISSEDLQAVTNDDDGAGNRTITFTLVSSPTLGRLVRVEPDNSTVEISTFTQAMVDEGVIAYEQTNLESIGWSAEDSFRFTVSSPPASLDPHVFNIAISYENTGPEQRSLLLANTGAVVTEGEKVLIDKSMLDASNLLVKLPEAQRHSYEVWYEVTSLPQHGVITVGQRNLTKEKPNFSQFILNKYGITYQHDDSESLQDHFTFGVWLNLKSKTASRPLDGSEVIEEVFNVTVTPVNDQPPELKTKSPGLRVVQGNKELLVPEHLNVVDLDNPPEDIKYTIISKPNNGFLAMGSSINDSIMTFTQADINRGRVWFVQDGSTFSGVFYFSVTDGKHRPLYKLFNLEVTEITIFLSNNTDVVLEQGQTSVVITNEQLAAETNGKNTTIHYLVTTPPQFGKLLITTEPVTHFEQEDLLQGRLSYQMTNLTSSRDSFEFTVFTSESNLTEQVLNITVKPLITLSQDTRVPNEIAFKLRSSMLNATQLSVLSGSDPHFEIVVPPTHSKILKSKKLKHGPSEPVLSFTLKDLEMGIVSLESKANMTAVQEMNDSFTFVLHAESTQPAIGVFLYVIVPYDPSLVPVVTTKSPRLTTASVITNQTALGEPQLPFSVEPPVVTKEPTKPVTRWKGRNRWGNPNRVAIPEPAVPDVASEKQERTPKTPVVEAAAHPSRASNPLLIILPLLACLLLVVILVVLIIMFRHRKEKQKPLIQNHPNNTTAPSSPSPCQPERSLAVPSVTVTPLLKGREAGADMGPRGIALETCGSPQETSLQLCTWNNLDPETLQHCRTSHPTLRNNQYWV
ncbi:chondroitin sulfate proteoglycan 4-like [Polyodon spathula]|uniref:chondroitin sulfate proteoglycan 4-like n=1 Tax=Polyodon spathula TaxID=7913 RepID=UPI001B7DD3A9|nr:chondroitin sulfate proteoglycan 4-like [Polyodon spathula]